MIADRCAVGLGAAAGGLTFAAAFDSGRPVLVVPLIAAVLGVLAVPPRAWPGWARMLLPVVAVPLATLVPLAAAGQWAGAGALRDGPGAVLRLTLPLPPELLSVPALLTGLAAVTGVLIARTRPAHLAALLPSAAVGGYGTIAAGPGAEQRLPVILGFVATALIVLHGAVRLTHGDPARPGLTDPARPDLNDPAQPNLKDPARPDLKDPARPDLKDPARPDLKDPARPDLKDRARPDLDDPARHPAAQPQHAAGQSGAGEPGLTGGQPHAGELRRAGGHPHAGEPGHTGGHPHAGELRRAGGRPRTGEPGHTAGWPALTGGRTGRERGRAVAAGLAAVAIAGVPLAALPGAAPGHAVDLRARVVPPERSLTGFDLIDHVAGWRAAPSRELFVVQRGPAGATWRLAILDRYDGDTWSATARFTPAGLGVPPHTGAVPPGAVETEVRITDLDDVPYLPALDRPIRVAPPVDAVDAADGILLTAAAPPPGTTYRVTSIPRPGAAAGPPGGLAGGGSAEELAVPDELRAELGVLTAGAGGATDVVRALRAGRRNVSGAPVSAGIPALRTLLGPDGTGTGVQFASVFALAMRLLGVPARLVVGFEPAAGRAAVHAGDVRVWVELKFARTGWVRHDPAPPPVAAGQDPPSPPGAAGDVPAPPPVRDDSISTPDPSPAGPPPWWLPVVLALVMTAFLGRRFLRRAWRRRPFGDPATRVLRAWHEARDAVAAADPSRAADTLTPADVLAAVAGAESGRVAGPHRAGGGRHVRRAIPGVGPRSRGAVTGLGPHSHGVAAGLDPQSDSFAASLGPHSRGTVTDLDPQSPDAAAGLDPQSDSSAAGLGPHVCGAVTDLDPQSPDAAGLGPQSRGTASGPKPHARRIALGGHASRGHAPGGHAPGSAPPGTVLARLADRVLYAPHAGITAADVRPAFRDAARVRVALRRR